jgi:hypothetical protein
MADELKIGIRELVEFCCRDGDLGFDGGPGVKALDGMQTHQKIQRRYQADAESEVSVKLVTRIDDHDIELGGRIDLLFATDSPPRIEEIKTVYSQVTGNQDDAVHWAQLKCYGACYAREHELDEVNLSLNLVTLFSLREQRYTKIFTRAELDAFVNHTLKHYLRWYQLVAAQREITRQQAQALKFPFANFRNQQRGFAAEVYRAIQNQQRLIVEAPTGSGKTISTLFPAIKAIGEDQCDQIIYLSAKVSGQQQAVVRMKLMTKATANVASVFSSAYPPPGSNCFDSVKSMLANSSKPRPSSGCAHSNWRCKYCPGSISLSATLTMFSIRWCSWDTSKRISGASYY